MIDYHAYTIPLMHAAKYPSSDVCGVLLGNISKDGQLEIKTAVPLFHHWTTLTPMLEVALKQTELFAKENGTSMVGWYHGHARLDNTSLSEQAIKVAETIKNNNASHQAVIFMIDNKQFSTLDQDGSAITAYVNTDHQWKKQKDTIESSLRDKETFNKVRGLFSTSAYQRIHDFDEHLEDVSIEWLENKLFI
ncbi:hypothetical protein BD560DRAFT_435828 [Blakeslea trispora]|nr:hypothetical protein BD560DRAFT_435828 [Blakeslea trispora]